MSIKWSWQARKLLFLTVFGLMALAIILPSASQASIEPSYLQVVNRQDNSCLDVTGASLAHAAKVGVWRCVGADNQQWRPEYVSDGFYRLRVLHSGMCLDVAYARQQNGADVVQATCVDGQNQQWRPVQVSSDGYYEFVARHSGRCLDKAGGSVVQWGCSGVWWQQWRLR
jgi:hypothetical protein